METYALPSPLTGKIIEKKLQMIDEDAERLLTDKDLEGYATEAFVTEKIEKAQISGSGTVDLTSYATKDYVDDALEGKEFLPSYDASNEGQFLRIIGGALRWATIANAEDSTF